MVDWSGRGTCGVLGFRGVPALQEVYMHLLTLIALVMSAVLLIQLWNDDNNIKAA